jgi:integrase
MVVMGPVKKCRHGRGRTGPARRRAWGRCRCLWVADLRIDGERRYIPLGCDATVARATYAQLVADRAAGRLLAAGEGEALVAVGERFIAALGRAGRKPRTLDAYRGHLRRIEEWFGRVPASAVRAADIAEFRAAAERDRDPGYVSDMVRTLLGVLTHAQREGLIDVVPRPAEPIRVRNEGRPRDRMSLAEVEATIAALRPDWRPVGELIYLTGLRIGEVLALVPEVIDLDRGTLRVEATLGRAGRGLGAPKTHSSRRTVALTPRARDLLAERLVARAPGERLFPGALTGGAQVAIRDAMDRAGTYRPKRGWHQLRHANTTLRDAARQSLRDAAVQLGHGAHTAMTMGYGWSAEAGDPARLDEARAIHAARPGG